MSEGVYLDLNKVHDLVLEVRKLRARHINWQPIEQFEFTDNDERYLVFSLVQSPEIMVGKRVFADDKSKWAWIDDEESMPIHPTHVCKLQGPSDE